METNPLDSRISDGEYPRGEHHPYDIGYFKLTEGPPQIANISTRAYMRYMVDQTFLMMGALPSELRN